MRGTPKSVQGNSVHTHTNTRRLPMSTPNPKAPARWSDFDRYLKPAHLGGKSWTLTISRIVSVEMHNPRTHSDEVKPVAYFTQTAKGLILTATHQKALRDIFGDDVADCLGKSVTLTATTITVAKCQLETVALAAAPAEAKKNGNGVGAGVPPPQAKPDPATGELPLNDAARQAARVKALFGQAATAAEEKPF